MQREIFGLAWCIFCVCLTGGNYLPYNSVGIWCKSYRKSSEYCLQYSEPRVPHGLGLLPLSSRSSAVALHQVYRRWYHFSCNSLYSPLVLTMGKREVKSCQSIPMWYSCDFHVIHMWLSYDTQWHSCDCCYMLWFYRNDTCVKGGESTLLDSFPVLEEMRECHPKHFATLTKVPATFQKIHYERYYCTAVKVNLDPLVIFSALDVMNSY